MNIYLNFQLKKIEFLKAEKKIKNDKLYQMDFNLRIDWLGNKMHYLGGSGWSVGKQFRTKKKESIKQKKLLDDHLQRKLLFTKKEVRLMK